MGLTDENIVKSLLRFFKSKLCKKNKSIFAAFCGCYFSVVMTS